MPVKACLRHEGSRSSLGASMAQILPTGHVPHDAREGVTTR